MTLLFSPIKLGALTVSNRIFVSPMCQYVAENGKATSWHMIHLGSLALSGAGLLCIEATAVEPEGRITPGDLGLFDDATEAALAPVIAAIRRHSNTAVVIQLAHAGRKASCHVPWKGGQPIPTTEGGWRPFAPSELAQKEDEPLPLALDKAGLRRVRDAFVESAKRAVRIGIDGIEIHGAHGYLLHEFLSPISNKRTDEYGGSLENRFRFPLEVFDAVRAAVPADKPIGIKLSATDWVPGGWDLEQTIAFASALSPRGVNWVTASSGGISPLQKIPVGPGYQVPFARGIKEKTGVITGAVGLITDPAQAEAILQEGDADYVTLARGMLYDPRWGWHAAAALGETIEGPPSYWRAPPHEHKDLFRSSSYGGR